MKVSQVVSQERAKSQRMLKYRECGDIVNPLIAVSLYTQQDGHPQNGGDEAKTSKPSPPRTPLFPSQLDNLGSREECAMRRRCR